MVTINKASIKNEAAGPAQQRKRSKNGKQAILLFFGGVFVGISIASLVFYYNYYPSHLPSSITFSTNRQEQQQEEQKQEEEQQQKVQKQEEEQEQEEQQQRVLPDEWWHYKTWEMSDYLDCEAIYDAGRPIHSHEDWVSLRNAYRSIVGKEKSSILPTDEVDGFGNVAVVAKIAPGKGRGVFAAQDIPKGTLVWTAKHQSAQFDDGHSYRQFLAAIPPDMACDVLMWAYVHDVSTDISDDDELYEPVLKINCDLDEGSFMNSANFVDGTDEDTANVACNDEIQNALGLTGVCHEHLFAIRVIKAGEEILCHYGDFALPRGWKKFGL